MARFIRSMLVLAAFAASFGAQAQELQRHTARTDQGCVLHVYDWEPIYRTYAWSGSCQSGQPINGQGVMTERFDDVDTGNEVVVRTTGAMVDGHWHGRVTTSIDGKTPFEQIYVMGCNKDWRDPCPTGAAASSGKRTDKAATGEESLSLEAGKNEHFVKFSNGCWRAEWFVPTPGINVSLQDMGKSWSKKSWSGECLSGFAHGRGRVSDEFSSSKVEFHLGQQSPWLRQQHITFKSSGESKRSAIWGDGTGNLVVLPEPGALDDPPLLRVTSPDLGPIEYEFLISFLQQDQSREILLSSSCGSMDSRLGSFPKSEQAKARRCRKGVPFYHLSLGKLFKPDTSRLCPDTRDARSCLSVYRELIAPYRDTLAAMIRDAPAGHERWLAEREPLLLAATRARDEKKAREEQAAAKRRAEAERLRVDEQTRRAQADADYRNALQHGSAASLYALADRLLEANDKARARGALRALMERFPDSPLATTAANRLATLSAPAQSQATAKTSSAARAGSSGANAVGSGIACAGTPVQHENQRLTPAFENLQRRCPQGSGPNWGSRADMQRVYWVMDETLKLLDQHRHCLADLYDGYHRDIAAARDQARNACNQLTSSGSCPLACPN